MIFSFGAHTFTFGNSELCQPIVTISATLTFDSEDQLTGRRYVNGTIGDSINFIFENGPIANGTLVNPIGLQYTFKEGGTWNKGE